MNSSFILVFALVTVIFIISMLSTISSFREIPLKLLESDEMLRPVTQVAVKKEKERLKAPAAATTTAIVITEKHASGISNGVVVNYSATNGISNTSISSSSDDDDDHDDDESHITFVS